MPPTIDLDLIKTFLTVVDRKGFKPAAEQLHRTPAAISQKIKRLEDLLGKKVLERSNQGISLTAAGQILKIKGEKMLSLNYELLGDLRENELAGGLKFGAPADYAPTLLQTLLPIFAREFPKVSPSITLEPSRAVRRKVQMGQLDMAIVAREPDTNEGIDLWSEEIAWFGSPLADKDSLRAGVLLTDCVLRDHALGSLRDGAKAHQIVLEAATVAALKDAVVSGFCQSLLPVSMMRNSRERELRLSNSLSMLTFCLISGSRFDEETSSKVASKFRDALQ
ncbi:MAG: LysR family transcriptional regulator [Boseongicola sp.]|nr:MAG: LysR family transcriptional regulator [Boseongicola sp.]